MRFSWKIHWHGIVTLVLVAIIAGSGVQANNSYSIINEVFFGQSFDNSENQFAPYTVSWNANKVAEDKTELHTKWINYLDEQGQWNPIDVTVRDDGANFVMDDAPFIFRAPKTSMGEAEFVSNVRYDIVGQTTITQAPTTLAITAQGVADVPGELFDMTGDGLPESVLYPLAYPDLDADLIYFVAHETAPVLQKLVRFHQAIQDTDISFRIRTDRALTVEVPREIAAEVDGVPVVDETPTGDEVPDETPQAVEETPAVETPTEETPPVESPPVEEVPVDEVPAETPAPVEETPAETPPADAEPIPETPAETPAPVETPAPEAPAETPVVVNEAPTVTEAAVLGETSETAVTIQAIEEDEAPKEDRSFSFESLVKQREEFRKIKQETLREVPANHRKGTFSFHDGDSMRGFGWRDPVIWDSVGKKERIEVSLERISPTEFVLTKHIQAAFFSGFVVYPVYTDTTTTVFPNFGSGTAGMDASIDSFGKASTWTAVHDASTGTTDPTLGTLSVRSSTGVLTKGAQNVTIDRAHTGFDTSAIPDTDTISAATVGMVVDTGIPIVNTDNDGDDWINVVQSTPASNTNIVGEDFDQIGTVDNPTEGATRIDIGAMSGGVLSTWTLNATGIGWISKTGITNFGWREGHDALDSPTADSTDNLVAFLSADTSGTSQDPVLTITHAAAGDPEEESPDSFIID